MELQIIGNLLDLCDGHQWATIAEHYRTFDFNFTTENTKIACPDLLLDTFRSSFWLELKSWFVAYDDYPSKYLLYHDLHRQQQLHLIHLVYRCIQLF